MEEIFKKVEDSISASSYKQYSRMWSMLGIKSIDDLKDTDVLLHHIEKKGTENTRKNYLAAVVKLMRTAEMSEDDIKPFFERMNHAVEKTKPSEYWNDKQKDNLMTMEEIEDIRKNMLVGITNFTTRHNYDTLLDFVILSLYTLIPPRRNEYFKMEVVSSPDDVKEGKNYLVWSPKKKFFVFQDYKTKKAYGKETIPIPPKLQDVIKFYLPIREKIALTSNQFLVKYGDIDMENSNDITRRLNRMLGRKVGASMLRHIFLSEKFGDTVKEMEQIAGDMGHSVAQQKEYIKK
jgi:hypothetical protein